MHINVVSVAAISVPALVMVYYAVKQSQILRDLHKSADDNGKQT